MAGKCWRNGQKSRKKSRQQSRIPSAATLMVLKVGVEFRIGPSPEDVHGPHHQILSTVLSASDVHGHQVEHVAGGCVEWDGAEKCGGELVPNDFFAFFFCRSVKVAVPHAALTPPASCGAGLARIGTVAMSSAGSCASAGSQAVASASPCAKMPEPVCISPMPDADMWPQHDRCHVNERVHPQRRMLHGGCSRTVLALRHGYSLGRPRL